MTSDNSSPFTFCLFSRQHTQHEPNSQSSKYNQGMKGDRGLDLKRGPLIEMHHILTLHLVHKEIRAISNLAERKRGINQTNKDKAV